jgi:V/A-type H+-transporting ATPase subunit D
MSTDKLDGINATRMELISLRTRKALAQNGYNLLNKKLETLTNELFNFLNSYREVQKNIRDAITQASKALTFAEMAMGSLKVKETALSFSLGIQLEARSRSLMGVKVPIISASEEELAQSYTYIDTSVKIDSAIKKFQAALQLIIKLAEVQSTITRLATEIQSTKRRVNALKNIVIPRIDTTAKWIALTLGEQEREEFVRLKKVKARLEAKEAEAK